MDPLCAINFLNSKVKSKKKGPRPICKSKYLKFYVFQELIQSRAKKGSLSDLASLNRKFLVYFFGQNRKNTTNGNAFGNQIRKPADGSPGACLRTPKGAMDPNLRNPALEAITNSVA